MVPRLTVRTGLIFAWTLRGAPHAYRRDDIAKVAVATAPWSAADAAKRIFDASRPLKAAGIDVVDALQHLAEEMRDIASRPTAKGAMSTALTARLDKPYLRYCRVCKATHVYENALRISSLQAGLELEPGTSPPVLRRIAGMRAPMYRATRDAEAATIDPRFDVVRNFLHFSGPAHARELATFLDAPLKEVDQRWPADVTPVTVRRDPAGARAGQRFVLDADLRAVTHGDGAPRTLRLLGAFDPYLQLRDRELLVPDASHRKDLWRTIGRPGAIVADGEVLGTWRPKASGTSFTLRIDPWHALSAADRELLDEQAQRLAEHRGATLAAIVND